jgi:hypothetical protein
MRASKQLGHKELVEQYRKSGKIIEWMLNYVDFSEKRVEKRLPKKKHSDIPSPPPRVLDTQLGANIFLHKGRKAGTPGPFYSKYVNRRVVFQLL